MTHGQPADRLPVSQWPEEKLTAAVCAAHDPGETLRRVNAVLVLYFDPTLDPATRAKVREEFVRALAGFPNWAVQRAFDAWVKTAARRPSPGEIVILAQRQMDPLQDELARRRKLRDAAQADAQERARQRPSADQAASLLELAGFTPKRMEAIQRYPMATSFAEAERDAQDSARHWTEREPADSAAMAQLRAGRDENALIRDARRAAGLAGTA